jgi:hypothetical protein
MKAMKGMRMRVAPPQLDERLRRGQATDDDRVGQGEKEDEEEERESEEVEEGTRPTADEGRDMWRRLLC